MEILIIIISGLLILIGLVGCLLPVLPGPPISYIGILLLQLKEQAPFSVKFLIFWAIVVAIVTALDYVVPIYGTKKMGGSRQGIMGSVAGLILGILFFPPFGIIIGPLLGAFIGELSSGKDSNKALKSAIGSFLGFLFGTILKLIVSGYLAYYFVASL